MKPPRVVNLDLEETDLREDLRKVLDAMRRIRQEAIQSRKYDVATREEYLHLASRLGSIIGESEDREILGKVEDLMGNEVDTTRYDRLQIATNRKHPQFAKNVQHASILLLGTDHSNPDDAYHVLQALNYLSSSPDERESHKGNCLSIKPFQDPIAQPKEGKLRKLAARLFGYQYPVVTREGLEIKLGEVHRFAPELIDQLRQQGHLTVECLLTRGRYEDTIVDGADKSEVGKDSGLTRSKFEFRDLEAKVNQNSALAFEEYALRELPPEVEKNLTYKTGRPSAFGSGVAAALGITEYDYKVLAEQMLKNLIDIVKDATITEDQLPKLNNNSREGFDRFVASLHSATEKIRVIDLKPEYFFPYQKGDEVVITRNHGPNQGLNNLDYRFGGNTNEIPLGTIAILKGRDKDNRHILYTDLGKEHPFKLSDREAEPTPKTKARFVEGLVEDAKKQYVENDLGSYVSFVADDERETLHFESRQRVGEYVKGTFMFLSPGKRTVITAFDDSNHAFEGIRNLGRDFTNANGNAKEIAAQYFEARQGMPYLEVKQYVNGKKVDDFEVRK